MEADANILKINRKDSFSFRFRRGNRIEKKKHLKIEVIQKGNLLQVNKYREKNTPKIDLY